ncbi:MAG: antitoxin family protein [Planctomycetota bacterium]
MEKTIKAKFSDGVIKPLEELILEEGKELIITCHMPLIV